MSKVAIRDLIQLTFEQVWAIPPTQPYTIVFDNGEVQTKGCFVQYNWYYWRLYREFTMASCLKEHYHADVFTGNIHLRNGEKLFWHIYENMSVKDEDLVWRMSKVFYEISNELYNTACTVLKPYTPGGSMIDLVEVLKEPSIVAAKKEYAETVKAANWDVNVVRDAIRKTHGVVENVLYKDRTTLPGNNVKRLTESNNVSKGQLLQLIGPRGFVQDIDGTVFSAPIDVGYSEGMAPLYDIAIESRSAARALLMNHKPLQDSEYNNRTMQLHCSVTHSCKGDDCGHFETIKWIVSTEKEGKADIQLLRGVNRMVNGVAKMLWDDEIVSLAGETIEVRTPAGCGNRDTQTVCRTCLGWFERVIPPGTNLGYSLSSALWAIITQLMLSTKHFEGSTSSLFLEIDSSMAKRIKRYNNDKSSILLQRPSGSSTHVIRISADSCPHINNILTTDIEDISPTRISSCKYIFIADAKAGSYISPFDDIRLTVAGTGSPLSHEMLRFMKEKGWSVGSGYIEVDMTGWDYTKPVVVTPKRGDNIYLFLNEVRSFLVPKGSGDEKELNIMSYKTRTAALTEYIMLLRQRVDVNMAVAAIIVRACMTRDATNGDYTLPRAGEPFEFTNAKQCLAKRSLAGAMAFESQVDVMHDPSWFVKRKRPVHLLDELISTP